MSKAVRIFFVSLLCMCCFSLASAESFSVGDQGNDVAEIQGALADLGFDVVADGDYGPGTVAAVKEFQASHGMNVDGQVGPATYSALLGKDMPAVSRGSNYYSRRIV
ncbi:MAG: peptidoglycan-binding protein [Schwartzia sp.]|nr:peptidoglycan-binding protein [Schwartzia sp. (in: firmicutes)]